MTYPVLSAARCSPFARFRRLAGYVLYGFALHVVR